MKNGEIWLVDLSDAKGHEQQGVRPAIVAGSANGMTVVIPCTTTLATARFSHTLVISPGPHNGLDAESIALVFQIVALDSERFLHRIGTISGQQWQAIAALLQDLLHLD